MKRERFGQRSERSQRLIDQLELSFEEAEAEAGAARATVPCFCAALRSLSTRSSRSRSGGETSNLIPVRMALNRMIQAQSESQKPDSSVWRDPLGSCDGYLIPDVHLLV